MGKKIQKKKRYLARRNTKLKRSQICQFREKSSVLFDVVLRRVNNGILQLARFCV